MSASQLPPLSSPTPAVTGRFHKGQRECSASGSVPWGHTQPASLGWVLCTFQGMRGVATDNSHTEKGGPS